MAQHVTPKVAGLINQLIRIVTKCEDDSDDLKRLEKQAHNAIKTTYYTYPKRNDIDVAIEGLVEKLVVHNLIQQSERLQELYNKVFTPGLTEEELEVRLNIVRFLIESAHRPTHNLYFKSLRSLRVPPEKEPEINWGEYLMEGIPKWSPPRADTDTETQSDIESETGDILSEVSEGHNELKQRGSEESAKTVSSTISSDKNVCSVYDLFRQARAELSEAVQYGWFNDVANGKTVRMMPPSDHGESNAAFIWEEHVLTHTLLPFKETSVITEYMVVREVLWQLYSTHQSAIFKFSGSEITIRDNITISSVRQPAFKTFMESFIPYINVLSEFRQIKKMTHSHLFLELTDPNVVVPPHTYQGYNEGLENILKPIYDQILDIEYKLIKQEESYTLIRLQNDLYTLMKPAQLLLHHHSNWIRNFTTHSALECVTHLLSQLRYAQKTATNRTEHDMFVSLYLECLYKYVTLIDNWLCKDDFRDIIGEFPIEAIIINKGNHNVQYKTRPLEDRTKDDTFLKIINTDVLHYGKNLNLLRVLKKTEFFDNMEIHKYDSLYQEFIEEFLLEVSRYFSANTANVEDIDDTINDANVDSDSIPFKFKFPILPDVKVPTEMDRVENLLDTSGYNMYLVAAFENVLLDKPKEDRTEKKTLYERLASVTSSVFPANLIMDATFRRILKNRFQNVAQKAVDCLKVDYRLEEHFNLLKHLYLMKDELLSPFFYKLFEQFHAKAKWGNAMWLTLELSDLVRNVYPEMYQLCTVIVKDNWQYHLDEPAYCCKLFRIKYKLKFPLTLIIFEDQLHKYEDLLLIMIQVKWSHYSLVNLNFSDIELPLRLKAQQPVCKALHLLQMKLKVLRFKVLGIVSSILHHIFGSLLHRHHDKLTADLRGAADVDSLITAHATFIDNLHRDCVALRNFNPSTYGFLQLLILVQELYTMWKHPSEIKDNVLRQCEGACEELSKNFEFYFRVEYAV